MPIYTGDTQGSSNSEEITTLSNAVLTIQSDLELISITYVGTSSQDTITHAKGRSVFAVYINSEGDYMPIDIQKLDDNTIQVSSVVPLNGTLLIL